MLSTIEAEVDLKWFIVFLLCAVNLIVLDSRANAGLREKIKERLLEKQQEKPAPSTISTPDKIVSPGDYTLQIKHAGLDRYYRIHVPKSYSSEKPFPLLLVLHGGGGDMNIQANDGIYGQISKSESEGFIAIFPNGHSAFASGKLATWNAGRCCGGARDKGSDDVGFLREIISQTQRQLSIDPQRIYAAGMSNGAMMAYRLACELPGTIRAIAAVAGTDNTLECSSEKMVSILHIHARDDDHVLYQGGAGKKAFPDKSKVTEFTSVPATIEKWRKKNRCQDKAKVLFANAEARCEVFESCQEQKKVQLCVTEHGGHSWPGGKKANPFSNAKASQAISANDVMWTFFRSLEI